MNITDSLKIFYHPSAAIDLLPNRKIVPISLFLYGLACLNSILSVHIMESDQDANITEYGTSFVEAMIFPIAVVLIVKFLFIGREAYLVNIANVYFHSFMPKILLTTLVLTAVWVLPQLKGMKMFSLIVSTSALAITVLSFGIFLYGINKIKTKYNVYET